MRPLIAERAPGAATPAPRKPNPGRPDPAPSRLSYRTQRLLLTPMFRRAVRLGLPMLALAGALGWYLSDQARVTALVHSAHALRRTIEERPEFRVALVDIRGASAEVTEEVRGALALRLPQSSFELDLAELRGRVEALPPVAAAELRVRSGGVLEVAVTERQPAVIWQTHDGVHLIDAEGNFVAAFGAREVDDPLPVVGGEGADRAVAEALALFEAAAPLGGRVQGLVRVGLRRWDVVLRDGPRLLLPAEDPVAALNRALAWDDVSALLDRDIALVDLRIASRPSVQLTPEALAVLRAGRSGGDAIEALERIAEAAEQSG